MSDYIAIEHNAETGETIERTMTQDEIDALMATFAGFNESTIVEHELDSDLPILASEPNPLPTDTTQ
jgi:hypothetical protein